MGKETEGDPHHLSRKQRYRTAKETFLKLRKEKMERH
jgi:hypothetical protein